MNSVEKVTLPYDKDRFLSVSIPSKNFAGAYSSKKVLPVGSPDALIKNILEHPIGGAPLSDMARDARNVLLVVDDNTRRTPVYRILPVLTSILGAAGILDSNVKILFASGTHRKMTRTEIIEKIGEQALNRFECFSHDYLSETVFFGRTKYGTPVEANPLLAWSDLTIAVGSIIPHPYCGWGGGGKMIMPGVCGARSILATHILPYQNPDIGIGVVENRARTEIDEASQMAGLKFIVNTILNADGAIADVVAGSPVEAHRSGIEKAVRVQGVTIPSADLVFGCSYPECSCYWQANKAFHPMEIAVNPGGLAVMVAAMPEGRGEHPDCFDAMGEPTGPLIKKLDEIKENDLDGALAIACALADRKLQNKARVGVISDGLPPRDTANGTFLRFNSPDEALKLVLDENPDAGVVCLLNAPEMLPMRGNLP
jgi:nickel-dependent lactate racemase